MAGHKGTVKGPSDSYLRAKIRTSTGVGNTQPSPWRTGIVCTGDCENCPLSTKGCARKCSRWPYEGAGEAGVAGGVCAVCPCRALMTPDNKPIAVGVEYTPREPLEEWAEAAGVGA